MSPFAGELTPREIGSVAYVVWSRIPPPPPASMGQRAGRPGQLRTPPEPDS